MATKENDTHKKDNDTPKKGEAELALTGGQRITGKIVHGKRTGLSAIEQGMKARGELDENNQPIAAEEKESTSTESAKVANDARTDKEKAADKKLELLFEEREKAAGDNSPHKVEETLYVGPISAEAIAAATGQKVSYKWVQAQPTTEDGLFHSFVAAHPSAKRDTFKIDPENKIDPTLRTYLERTRPQRKPASTID